MAAKLIQMMGPVFGISLDSQKTEYKKNNSSLRGTQQIPQISVQVQLQEYNLGIEDISPIWNSRLKGKWPTLFSKTWFKWYFELKRTSKCVVGEAHGYSSSYIYSCKECDDIGWKFMFYYTINSRKKLELNKNRFVKHWNEAHLCLHS
jgi:hypothetical protein